MTVFVAATMAACKPAPLPELDTRNAQTYVNRCGQCHAAFNPHELTASMWEMQVPMMEVKIQSAGLPPLTSDEREAILDYLKRNAGHQ